MTLSRIRGNRMADGASALWDAARRGPGNVRLVAPSAVAGQETQRPATFALSCSDAPGAVDAFDRPARPPHSVVPHGVGAHRVGAGWPGRAASGGSARRWAAGA